MIRFVPEAASPTSADPITPHAAGTTEEGTVPAWEFHDPSAGGHALLVLPADPGIPVSRYRDFPT